MGTGCLAVPRQGDTPSTRSPRPTRSDSPIRHSRVAVLTSATVSGTRPNVRMLMVETVRFPAGLAPGKYFNNPNPRNTAPRLIRRAVMLFRTSQPWMTPSNRTSILRSDVLMLRLQVNGLLPMDRHGRFTSSRRARRARSPDCCRRGYCTAFVSDCARVRAVPGAETARRRDEVAGEGEPVDDLAAQSRGSVEIRPAFGRCWGRDRASRRGRHHPAHHVGLPNRGGRCRCGWRGSSGRAGR